MGIYMNNCQVSLLYLSAHCDFFLDIPVQIVYKGVVDRYCGRSATPASRPDGVVMEY